MTSISIVENCFNTPSWQGWMKFFEINWNWSLSPMNFLISLLSIFNKMIGLNILEELYEVLLSLGIMMELDILKCDGQYHKLIYAQYILFSLFSFLFYLFSIFPFLKLRARVRVMSHTDISSHSHGHTSIWHERRR